MRSCGPAFFCGRQWLPEARPRFIRGSVTRQLPIHVKNFALFLVSQRCRIEMICVPSGDRTCDHLIKSHILGCFDGSETVKPGRPSSSSHGLCPNSQRNRQQARSQSLSVGYNLLNFFKSINLSQMKGCYVAHIN